MKLAILTGGAASFKLTIYDMEIKRFCNTVYLYLIIKNIFNMMQGNI